MRKIVICTSLLFILCLHTFSPYFHTTQICAQAEEISQTQTASYACALSHDVYLYASENENSGLFRIPYTYYVKIISTGITYCYVQYSTDTAPFEAIYGYCKTDELYFVNFIPVRPFLYQTVEVTYQLEDYPDFFSQDEIFSSITLTYAYYGDYTVGSSTYCYVSSDGKMGYLPKTMDVSYELNTDYLSMEEPTSTQEPTTAVDLPTEQIVFAVVIVLLALGLTYYLLRPRSSTMEVANDDFE